MSKRQAATVATVAAAPDPAVAELARRVQEMTHELITAEQRAWDAERQRNEHVAKVAQLEAENERLRIRNDNQASMIDGYRQDEQDSETEIERLRMLLSRLLEWDHLDGSADGPYWRGEIESAVGARGASDPHE